MPTRREFMQTCAPAILGGRLPCGRQRQRGSEVNTRLQNMASSLIHYPDIKKLKLSLVDGVDKGLVHWEQLHFMHDSKPKVLQQIEQCQKELLRTLSRAMRDPTIGLTRLHTEGYTSQYLEKEIDYRMESVRDAVRAQLQTRLNYMRSGSLPAPVANAEVEQHMNNLKMLSTPHVHSITYWDDGDKTKRMNVSALGHQGAALILHHLNGLELDAAEDNNIFIQSDPERMRYYSKQKRDYLMLTARDEHVVQIAEGAIADILHVIFGCDHDFTDYARKRGVSVLEVIPREVANYEK
ncbi:MAG: hypothetical protein K9M03_01215 [Kiritimatiellales bacterium]|nr:hypothetical protein [Kiritimatiellales bacterium]